MIVSKPVLVISSIAEFCTNFNLSIIVLCVFLSITLIIANPDISSINSAFTFSNLCFLDLNTIHSFGKIGVDLIKKLKQQSHEFMIPSNSNIFLIPKTRSTFSCISDTKVYILNLCPCMSTIFGIMNNTLMNYPFLTWILCGLDANCGREWSDSQCK